MRNITGYISNWSARPGESIDVMISSDSPGAYRAHVVRLRGCDSVSEPATFSEDVVVRDVVAEKIAIRREVQLGSFALASDLSLSAAKALTVFCFVRLTFPSPREMTAVCVASAGDGVLELGVTEGGFPYAALGGTRVVGDCKLPLARWVLLAARVSAGLCVLDAMVLVEPCAPALAPWSACWSAAVYLPENDIVDVWIGASVGRRKCFTGKIEAPTLVRRVVRDEELIAVASSTGSLPTDGVLAAWDLSADPGGATFRDVSAGQHHAKVFNTPMRAVSGRLWTGEHHDWRFAPAHYGAVHFHADDITDAEWPADFSYSVPEEMPSGLYAFKLEQGADSGYLPFYVLPPKGETQSKIAFLAPTATYLAYANVAVLLRAAEFYPQFGRAHDFEDFLARHPEYGGSLYERREDGSGIAYSSWHRPILNFAPHTMPWAFVADGDILAYLTHVGVEVDVITDDVLDREGAELLAPYNVILTGTHPEYASEPMLAALEAYLRSGGRLMYLGGNGFYWRASFNRENEGLIEVRRAEDGTRAWASQPGEYRHAFDGTLGGLWRRQGRAPQKLVGVGFCAQGFFGGGHFERTSASDDPRAAFIFEGVTEREIGKFGAHGGGAVGEEIDRADVALGTPAHALILAHSTGLNEGMLRAKEELLQTVPTSWPDPGIRADMVFFETDSGGAVFSTGSISWAASLAHNGYDNNVAKITANVLRRFAATEAFPPPPSVDEHAAAPFDPYATPVP